jgi:hypothetical protein
MVLSDIVLPGAVPAHLHHIQTAAYFRKAKNVYIRVEARKQRPREAGISIAAPPDLHNHSRSIAMKEKARNVKTDKKYWTDPMSFPVFTPKRGR